MQPAESNEELKWIPKHERLRAYLLKERSSGRLKPGDALPTELELTQPKFPATPFVMR